MANRLTAGGRRISAQLALGLILLGLAVVLGGCARRVTTIEFQSEDLQPFRVSGSVLLPEPLQEGQYLEVRPLPTREPPAHWGWLLPYWRYGPYVRIYQGAGRQETREGRTWHRYPWSWTLPTVEKMTQVTTVREWGLLQVQRRTASRVWQPGGFRIQVTSPAGWRGEAQGPFRSSRSGVVIVARRG